MPSQISDFSSDAVQQAMQDLGQLKTQPELSYGQKLVGINFNPSADDKVSQVKNLCAQLADIVNNHWENKEHTRLENQLYDHAIGEILNAQMNAVKLLTLKY